MDTSIDKLCNHAQNRHTPPKPVDLEAIYLANRTAIEQAIRNVCRRQRLSAADGEEFASVVHLRLITDEYAVLRKFEGRSSLRTYLITVVTHVYLDWRNARWGKWRPSEGAKRKGALAVQLERLLTRDGLGFEEACEVLRTNHGVTETRESLETVAAALTPRAPRRFVAEDTLNDYPDTAGFPDAVLEQREAAAAARGAVALLSEATARLPPEDHLILKMRFHDGFSIADIARFLNLDQKGLYRRIDRLLADLRTSLQGAGLTDESAMFAIEQGGFAVIDDPADERQEFPGEVRLFEKGDAHDRSRGRLD